MSSERTIVGVSAIAAEIGVCDRTVKNWIKDGKLKVGKPGGRTSPARISAKALHAFKIKMNGGKG